MTTSTTPLVDLLRSRYSVRKFLPTPMSAADIRGVLEDAQTSPSNSNTQPWAVHVVSGAARDAISGGMLRAHEEGRTSSDFTFGYGDGLYASRAQHHGATLYEALGVARSDVEGRNDVVRDNLRFYGAPHAAFLFMPLLGDGVRTAGDIGMYAQTFLLSLTARGFHGIPQTILGMYADVVREVLGVPEELKLLFGISFGTADPAAKVNELRMHRLPMEQSVVFHDEPAWGRG
ncbi:nitroreductase [Mycolicibacterium litorale]|uniref:Nitroreductase NfnB n=1 Tax=Mycolicibacterium litorale TaxID=758802 RepID=A0AAD1INL9_9MYCO|nr:nitroreductase [Mycolicibacterium litorale]MCV7417424.1 nitroreductase [Mycolicibacterium litorale]TDY05213.1 nitroreductase [Mycolicibacterium litorale]BBY18650.1 nitroreductase NfnB [Mycolicibacterium litorale]